jgi:hypothetical protein
VAAGTCTIKASQSGNATYGPVPKVNRSFAVAKASQSIAFEALADLPIGSAPFSVTAKASSGLTVTVVSATKPVCTIKRGKVTVVSIGTCTLKASQSGNANYDAAPDAVQSFVVTSATPASQTISFVAPPDRGYGMPPFAVDATASSGLPVILTSLSPAACVAAGLTVTLVAPGICTLRATQEGNGTYAPAPPVERSFAVTAPVPNRLQYSYDGAGNVIGIRRTRFP